MTRHRPVLGLAVALIVAVSSVGCRSSSGDSGDSERAAAEPATTEPSGCPRFRQPVETGTIEDPALDEISGMASSRRTDGTYWVHNDSGGGPFVYAVTAEGAVTGRVEVRGAKAWDWEDVAAQAAPDGAPHLYIGDIGDNTVTRGVIRVLRLPEPATTATGSVDADLLTARYPDGPHDAESLLVDTNGDIYIVTKTDSGDSGVYRWPAPQAAGSEITLEPVTRLQFGQGDLAGSTDVTAGDIAPDGSAILLRTYSSAFVWPRTPGTPLAEALAVKPCPVPLALETQGEAAAWTATGGVYVTLSEFRNPPLNRYDPR